MCGIVGLGFKDRQHSSLSKEQRDVLSKFWLTELLRVNMVRGEDATGAAVFWPKSGFCYAKVGWNADKFLDFEEKEGNDFSRILAKIDSKDYTFIMGHDRKRTKGSEWNNKNNHPVHRGNIVMVHNGTIVNEDSIFKKIKGKVAPKESDVDSEALAAWFECYFNDKQITREGIEMFSTQMDGAFTTFIINRLFPNKVVVTRTGRTLSVGYHHPTKFLVLTSEENFLHKVRATWNRYASWNKNLFKMSEKDFSVVNIGDDNAMIMDMDVDDIENSKDGLLDYINTKCFEIKPMHSEASKAAWTENGANTKIYTAPTSKTTNTTNKGAGVTNVTSGAIPLTLVPRKCLVADAKKLVLYGDNRIIAKTGNQPVTDATSATTKSIEASLNYLDDDAWSKHLDALTEKIFTKRDLPCTPETKPVVLAAIRAGLEEEYARWEPVRKTVTSEIVRLSSIVEQGGTTEEVKALKQMFLCLFNAATEANVDKSKIFFFLERKGGVDKEMLKSLFTEDEYKSGKVR